MKESTRNLALLLVVLFIVEPWILQTAFAGADQTRYLDSNVLIADHETKLYYHNTTGHWISQSPGETQIANGTWTITTSLIAQDTSEKARLLVTMAASELWNSTAFDPDTADHITAVGVRVETDSEGVAMALTMGFGVGFGDPYADMIASGARILTSESDMTLVYITPGDFDVIDSASYFLTEQRFKFWVEEADADQFITGKTLEVQLEFYSGVTLTTFNSYLLYLGVANMFAFFVMTRGVDLSPNKRRSKPKKTRRKR